VAARGARLLRGLLWGLLALAAALGVALAGLAAFAASDLGRPVVARLLIGQVDAALAGRFALQGFEVLPEGGLELRGLEVYDPEDRLVLQVTRARLFADVTRLRQREVGLSLELYGTTLLLETGADGRVSLAEAFAPSRPSPSATAAGAPKVDWTLRLTRLTLRDADVWWQGSHDAPLVEASGVALDAVGTYGPRGGFLELDTRGTLAAPVEGPFALRAAAWLEGDRLVVPVLDGSLAGTHLAGLGQGNLASGAFRAALTRLELDSADAVRLLPALGAGRGALASRAELQATGYAEGDGRRLSAALVARTGDGEARLATALDLPAPAPARTASRGWPLAVGLDVALAAFDPSRLVAQAPPARLTLTARGSLAGTRLADARGRLSLDLALSTLRAGAIGPATVAVVAAPGLVEVTRLDLRLPGVWLTGEGRWREGGAVSGRIALDGADLGRATDNLAALLGQAWPRVSGRAALTADLSGTDAAPRLSGALDLPHLALGDVTADGGRLEVEAVGPIQRGSLRVQGLLARASIAGAELRGARLAIGLSEETLTGSLTGVLSDVGTEPASLVLAGKLTPGRTGLALSTLTFGWPGSRYGLQAPATLTFEPLAVDRLALADGAQALVLTGGFAAGKSVDARLEISRLDLARLPRGLLPASLGLAGQGSVDVRAAGPETAPRLTAHLVVAGGAARGVDGLQLLGDLGWDAGTRRLSADLGLVRTAGGTLDLAADLPLPWPFAAGRAAAPLSLTVRAAGWPAELLAAAAAADPPATGRLGVEATLGGTVGAPTLAVAATLDGARRDDLGPLDVVAAIQLPSAAPARGSAGGVELQIAVRRDGHLLATAHATAPLDPAALLATPVPVLRALRRAPLEAEVDLPGAALAPFAGQAGLPEQLSGTLAGHATLRGSLDGPRGPVHLAATDLRWGDWPAVSASADVTLAEALTSLEVSATAGGAPALRLKGSLGAAVEALAVRATLAAAPLTLQAEVPDLPLDRLGGAEPPVVGTIQARLGVTGTLADPEVRLEGAARGLVVEGRPLGDVGALLRSGGGEAVGALTLAATTGGTLAVDGTLKARLGLDTTLDGLGHAEVWLHAQAPGLDLGALAAVAPRLVRAASGRMALDLTADGRLRALRPRGTLRIDGGRLAIAEYGDWSEVALDVAVAERSIDVTRLSARRGGGRLSGTFSGKALGLATSRLTGQLTLEKLTLSRTGIDLVTLDFPVTLGGSWTDSLLDLQVTIPRGTVQLPRKTPRALQSLEPRPDIVVGRPRARRTPAVLGVPAPKPMVVRVHLVAPGKLFVKDEAPRINVELKTDSTWSLVEGELLAEGPVEVVRGTVEPISGRVFVIDHGKVEFNGAGWPQGQIEAVAIWENPAAAVTATVDGSLGAPALHLSSVPELDETAIAILIATGRTELRAGTTDIGSMDAKAAGYAATGAAFTYLFRSKVAAILPLDQVAIDSGALRAGKYLTDRIFVGYTRRFDANPELHENPDEVRVDYQISKRWTLESTYGNAQTGGVSLIWKHDY
jgi:translocation and assembly module TamB